MGRAPCCDKANVKKGPWSPEEDEKLKAYIEENGTGGNWIALPQKIGLKRCGKSCRLRWLNYLRPNIKHGGFSEEEDNIICSLYLNIGSRWSIIAAQLPGRTDNDIKNYWNTRLKKKFISKQRKEQSAQLAASSVQKEMMKKDGETFMVNSEVMMNQIPYWPEPTVPFQAPNPSLEDDHLLNDQASIMKLLVTLGGRFVQDDQKGNNNSSSNFQYPFDISPSQDQLYDNSINAFESTTSMNNSTYSQIQNIFEGFNNCPIGLGELGPRQSDGLESFSGVEMVNGSSATGTSYVESTNWEWGDMMNSLVYPFMVSNNYDAFRRRALQDCTLEEPRFFGGLQ